MTRSLDAVVFDLGGVLIDWNPRHLYRSMFGGDDAAMERFLVEVCSPAWNIELDAGLALRDGVAALVDRFPEQRDLIVAYDERWTEMLGGPIDGTVAVLADLRRAGIRVAALSNWSADTFPIARSRYAFLDWFETILISGEVGICKPDPRIYERLFERTGLVPASSVFVDDVEANVTAASALGMTGLRFEDPTTLRRQLEQLGMLPRVSSAPPPGR